MTQTTKEVFEKYQVRKTKKQRTAFIEYVKGVCDKYGYTVNTEKGSCGAMNIVVGDPDNAKIIYTAHYDTCARLPFPNFITPKNFLVYLLYQLLVVAGFFAVSILVYLVAITIISFINIETGLAIDISTNLAFFVYFFMVFLMLFGPANKHTANDNTSGVTTLLDIMTALPESERDKAAFVFFDLEEMGLFGSSSFASKHKGVKKNKPVINFDCVSDGKTMLFALKRGSKKYKDLLASAFESTNTITVDITPSGAFYPSDNASFRGGVGVAALKKSKFTKTLYMNRIHTNRDTVYDEENIEFLKNGAIKLCKLL